MKKIVLLIMALFVGVVCFANDYKPIKGIGGGAGYIVYGDGGNLFAPSEILEVKSGVQGLSPIKLVAVSSATGNKTLKSNSFSSWEKLDQKLDSVLVSNGFISGYTNKRHEVGWRGSILKTI